jgi:hypothetical protein
MKCAEEEKKLEALYSVYNFSPVYTNKCAPLLGGISVPYASISHVPSYFCRAVEIITHSK